ncbi:hypothetical protein [Streptomyces silvisoli]|uniref:Uncharacterized protein n=1 Tax=Streptomyces silvisoli TaxID=3034235 RepID=A0ABT5ZM54_9ACTN|nr:hypothetical protein [Streptomyces silvisoli]MDF3290914.1 hypothetical protein [Streptomyces silvisoli]
MPPKASLVTAVTLGAVGLGSLAVIGGPGAVDWFRGRHVQQASYDNGRVAKSDRASMPRWLPDTATAVHYRMSTTGGDRLLKATLSESRLPHGCKPGGTQARAHLRASWFPKGTDHKPQATCGGTYNAVLRGKELYAWQDNASWVAAHKTPREHAPSTGHHHHKQKAH